MKVIKRVLLTILIIVLMVAALVVALRLYNAHKYHTSVQNVPAYLINPRDISAYPTTTDGAAVTPINHRACQGLHLVPHQKTHAGIVVCYGGSEGSPNFQVAEHLANDGYETLALFMFGMEHQPQTLREIPLEQFEDVLDYIDSLGLKDEPLTVYGASKGAEYALHLADKYPHRIHSLILMSPSSYTFLGLDQSQMGSSWTWHGEELPYINMQQSSFSAFITNIVIPMVVKSPVSYAKSYDTAIDMDPDAHSKRIPLDAVQADILIFAGGQDAMWNSASMAEQIKDRLGEQVQLHIYPDAGHIFYGHGVLGMGSLTVRTGGTAEANEAARLESTKLMDEFLAQHHAL